MGSEWPATSGRKGLTARGLCRRCHNGTEGLGTTGLWWFCVLSVGMCSRVCSGTCVGGESEDNLGCWSSGVLSVFLFEMESLTSLELCQGG